MKTIEAVGTGGIIVVLLAGACGTLPRGYAAGRTLAARDDPVRLTDQMLEQGFDPTIAAQEIRAALHSGDPELAASFVELGRERGVSMDPALAEEVRAAVVASQSTANQVHSFARGFLTGQPDSLASFAGTAVGDLFLFGDLRDATRETAHAVRGQDVDKVVLGLSVAGIAVSAGTYATLGAGAPARVGLSLLKVASKARQLGSGFTRLARLNKTEALIRVASDLGHVQAKAGTRAAVEGLKLAEGPKDVSRLARLAEGEGTKTRAVIKLFGRGAMMLSSGLFELASWVFWALANVLGLCAAIKRGAERTALSVIRHNKRRRARRTRPESTDATILLSQR